MSYDYGTQDNSETVYSSVMPLEKSSSAYKKRYKKCIKTQPQSGCVLIHLDR